MPVAKQGALLVGQSGGPTAVINATLAGVVEEAQRREVFTAILGMKYGLAGALRGDFVDLTGMAVDELERLVRTPSCALGTSRRPLTQPDYEQILNVLRANGIRYFLLIGGNGSMVACHKLATLAEQTAFDVQILGLPKTVDNDVRGTDHTPGYGSAARFMAMSVRDAGLDLEAMRTFEDVVILESMGRDAGWLAASSGLGRETEEQAPHLLYLPEYTFDEAGFLDEVAGWHRRLGVVFVVAGESLRNKDGRFLGHEPSELPQDEMGRTLYGFAQGTGSYLSRLVLQNLGLRARFMRPGTLGRVMSCCVSETDRAEARFVGRRAVVALLDGASGQMVMLERLSDDPYACQAGLVPLDEAASGERLLFEAFYDAGRRAITPAFKKYALPLIGGPLPQVTGTLEVPVT